MNLTSGLRSKLPRNIVVEKLKLDLINIENCYEEEIIEESIRVKFGEKYNVTIQKRINCEKSSANSSDTGSFVMLRTSL